MIYFDNAATTFPKPGIVVREVVKCMNEYCGNPGRSSHKLSLAAAEKVFECRNEIASLFHSQNPENVVFTYNTTYALNMAVKTFVTDNSHVIISNVEHNSVYRPICALKDNGVEYTVINAFNSEDDVINDIKNAIRPNTALVIMSHYSNICGIVLPIERIGILCHENHLPFVVDAAQSAGSSDIDLNGFGISALCAPGHKGLYGPQGTGFVLFNESYNVTEFLKNAKFIHGGNGVNSLDSEMPNFLPEHFEAGTLATPSIAGLCAGIKFVKQRSTDAIRNHEIFLYRRLREMLMNISKVVMYNSEKCDSGIILFNIKDSSPNEIASHLDNSGICVRSGFHCSPLAHKYLETGNNGAIRVSFGAFNTRNEVDSFYHVLKKFI